MKTMMLETINKFFRPEFINRIDEMVVFHSLKSEHLIKIAHIQLKKLCLRLENQGYFCSRITENVLLLLSKIGFDPVYGARPLKRVIQNKIENPLSQKILLGNLLPGKKITLDSKKGEIVFFQ